MGVIVGGVLARVFGDWLVAWCLFWTGARGEWVVELGELLVWLVGVFLSSGSAGRFRWDIGVGGFHGAWLIGVDWGAGK